MIDLSGFDTVGGAPNPNESYLLRTEQCKTAPRGQLTLYIGVRQSREVESYLGSTCRLLVSWDRRMLAIARGDDKRISHVGGEHKRSLSLLSQADRFDAAFPDARKVYLDTRWETDESGNKVLLFEASGRVEHMAPVRSEGRLA